VLIHAPPFLLQSALEDSKYILAADTADPRIRFLESLYQATLDAGSIVVYGSYENTQLSNLSRWFPAHAARIGSSPCAANVFLTGQ